VSHPQFLTDLVNDAQSLGYVRHVDSRLVLETMLLLLTHFVGNIVCDHEGEPVNVARNVMLLSSRRSCPLWLKPIVSYLHSRNEEQTSDFMNELISSGLMQQPEDDDDDVVTEMLRRAQPSPFPMHDMFEHGFSLFSSSISRYMIVQGDGPRMSSGMAEDGAVLLVEGSQHLQELCGAPEQCSALWGHLEQIRPRVSLYGWCEGNTGILDTELPGMPLLLRAPYGSGLHMNTVIEDHGVVHHRNVFYDPGRSIQGFTTLLGRLLNMRAAGQVMGFEPNARCRELLRQAHDAEHRDIQEFPEAHRKLAAPVMGLGLSLSALFWTLEYRPRMPMETVALTSMAVDIAQDIRRRSLGWLRRELEATCISGSQMVTMDLQVLDKMRQAGCMLRPRQIQRMFHCMHSRELHETLGRLQARGLVQNHEGKVVAV